MQALQHITRGGDCGAEMTVFLTFDRLDIFTFIVLTMLCAYDKFSSYARGVNEP